jgi:hypothetical protein
MSTSADDLEAVRKVVDALTPFKKDDQERIVRWAREKLGLSASFESAPATSRQSGAAASSSETSVSLREFVAQKQPKADVHFVAVVAYYYQFEAKQSERKDAISASDIQEACRLAKRTRFKEPNTPLLNAFANGYLDKVDRGSYKINSVGENLVAMALPGGTSSSDKTPRRKDPRSKPAKRRPVK